MSKGMPRVQIRVLRVHKNSKRGSQTAKSLQRASLGAPLNPSPKGSFVPPPLVSEGALMMCGFAVFVAGYLWLPSLLVITFLVSKFVPYSFRTTDDASTRRKAHKEFLENPEVPCHLRQVPGDIQLEERYWTNSRGMLLQTSVMVPKDEEVEAVVCFCHGYASNASFLSRNENIRFVREKIAVVSIEYEGHGRSDGPSGLVYDFDQTVTDVVSYFEEITRERFPGKRVFLKGESMGGAVAFSTYNRRPDLFSGVVFVAPMCKLGEAMRPPQWVIELFKMIAGPKGSNQTLGYLPIAPAKSSLDNITYKRPEIRDLAALCPTGYFMNPRLTTAREVYLATERISDGLASFHAPFLVMHGKADKVTDPQLSQALYDEACSTDKSIRLYEGMWHSITCGEPEEGIDMVFRDAVNWIKERI